MTGDSVEARRVGAMARGLARAVVGLVVGLVVGPVVGLVVACGGDDARVATHRSPTPAAAAITPAPAPAPPRDDLYACEGCEAALERPADSLRSSARLAAPKEPGERLIVRGRVVHADGHTPAAGVVVYAYQTNAEGLYAGGTPDTEWSLRHGRLRGWVRTGADGRYELDTIKPGRYPDLGEPAHIHLTVLEPGKPPYWIDDVVFAGEPGVTDAYRKKRELRGGDGVVTLQRGADGTLIAERDIVLERHPSAP